MHRLHTRALSGVAGADPLNRHPALLDNRQLLNGFSRIGTMQFMFFWLIDLFEAGVPLIKIGMEG